MGQKHSQTTAQVPPTGDFLAGPIVFGPYYLVQEIGKGSFGVAYLAVLRRDFETDDGASPPSLCRDLFLAAKQLFVVKRFRTDFDAKEVAGMSADELTNLALNKMAMFEKERKAASWLRGQVKSHPNLVEFVCEIDDKETSPATQALVFEYCNCGDIRRLVSRCKDASGKLVYLTQYEALNIAIQLCQGLAALHKHKIIHRDISLRNLFVHCDAHGELTFKIGDFGLCLDLGDIGATDEPVKYGAHVAPEKVYSERSDVYSLGLVLYELFSLVDLSRDTLYDLNTTATVSTIQDIVAQADALKERYGPIANVVAGMLAQEVSDRLSVKQALTQFELLMKAMSPRAGQPCHVLAFSYSFACAADAKFRSWLTEVPRASPLQTTFDLDPTIALFAGQECKFTIHARDPLGQPRLTGGELFSVTITRVGADAKDSERKASVHDQHDGKYAVHFTAPARCGKYTLSVLLENVAVKSTPTTLAVVERVAVWSVDSVGPLAVSPDTQSLFAGCDDHIRVLKFDGSEVRRWGRLGRDDGCFECVGGLAVGSASDGQKLVFVSDAYSDRIQTFRADGSGTLLGKWGSGQGEQHGSCGNCVDSKAQEVFVVKKRLDCVQVFNFEGKLQRQFGAKGSGDGQLSYPHAIALDSRGGVCVSDINNHRLQQFDRNGVFVRKFGTEGSGNGQFRRTLGVCISADGVVYACDELNNRLQVFSSDLRLLRVIPLPIDNCKPHDVALGPDGLMFVSAVNRIFVLRAAAFV